MSGAEDPGILSRRVRSCSALRSTKPGILATVCPTFSPGADDLDLGGFIQPDPGFYEKMQTSSLSLPNLDYFH